MEEFNLPPGKSEANSTSKGGAPTSLTKTVAEAIIRSVRKGNYISPAAEAAGVARNTVSKWRQKAEHGIEPYYSFFERVQQAMNEAEAEVVSELREHDDWRAKAWWLERGPARERWQQQQVSPATELAVQLLDVLRSPQQAHDSVMEQEFAELPEARFKDLPDANASESNHE